jgi:hypothetical protein
LATSASGTGGIGSGGYAGILAYGVPIVADNLLVEASGTGGDSALLGGDGLGGTAAVTVDGGYVRSLM